MVPWIMVPNNFWRDSVLKKFNEALSILGNCSTLGKADQLQPIQVPKVVEIAFGYLPISETWKKS